MAHKTGAHRNSREKRNWKRMSIGMDSLSCITEKNDMRWNRNACEGMANVLYDFSISAAFGDPEKKTSCRICWYLRPRYSSASTKSFCSTIRRSSSTSSLIASSPHVLKVDV